MFDRITQFGNPEFLWFLLVIPGMIVWYVLRSKQSIASITYSSLSILENLKPSWRVRLRHIPFILRCIVIAFLIFAFARPQTSARGENIFSEGIDITLVLDISGSMLAEDFQPNRLEAAKKVAREFIDGRISDRIGLVIFAGESFTQCPLTTDYQVLKDLLSKVKMGMLEDGTAIGEGIANGVNRMRNSKSKSKVMILLTDGVNNRGAIDPATGAQIAQSFGIRIYTIGVGTRGYAPYPVQTPFGIQYQRMEVDIDETMLKQVASLTGGQYFRATGNQKLKEIYAEIDKMEKSKIEVKEFRRYTELFYQYVIIAFSLLMIEFIFSGFILRKIP